MMKTLRLSFAFVASIFAGLAVPQAGNAQFYERILPIDEILYVVEERGFEPISRPQLRGDVYVVEVIDPRGRRARLSVDAFDGIIIGSLRPRETAPAPVYREARPDTPFGARRIFRDEVPAQIVPDRGVRDLRDPSTRRLVDPGSSVRIERVPVPSESTRAAPEMPQRAPVPPARPQELVVAPDAGSTLPREAEREARPTRRAAPHAPEPTAPPAAISEQQRSVIERTTPVPRSTPLRSEAQVEARARQREQQVERMPAPRGEELLEGFSPDEIDQMDMYLPTPSTR